MWGPDYEDRRLSYCSMDTGSLDRDLKSNLQTLECLSGSEQDLTPHDSSDDEDEVLCGDGIGTLYALKHLHCRATKRKMDDILALCFCLCCVLFIFLFSYEFKKGHGLNSQSEHCSCFTTDEKIKIFHVSVKITSHRLD